MPKLNSPCYQCEKRAKNCFSSCEKYKAYKIELAERLDLRAKDRAEGEYFGYLRDLKIKYSKTASYKNKRKGT